MNPRSFLKEIINQKTVFCFVMVMSFVINDYPKDKLCNTKTIPRITITCVAFLPSISFNEFCKTQMNGKNHRISRNIHDVVMEIKHLVRN